MRKVNRWIVVVLIVIGLSLGNMVESKAATLEVGLSGYPYTSIQGAINAAVSGVDEVLVHDGTYVENINFLGKAITVRSENGAATTIIDGNAQDIGVTFNSGEGVDSVLDGFLLTNGVGSGPNGAGGIYCESSSPSIQNCTISNNSGYRGGGIACQYSSSPTITNCVIKNNSASYGAGIYCEDFSSPVISNCTINGNSGGDGGGISVWVNSAPVISNCIISDNSANHMYGGGICCYTSSPTLTNCTIKDNYSGLFGGGVGLWSDASPIITSCVISGNRSDFDGGGIYIRDNNSFLTVANSTVAYNTAETGRGGGLYSYHAFVPTFVNSILWGDRASGVPEEIETSNGASINNITYSIIEGGYTGTGNTAADPLFLNSSTRNYRLQFGSPGIDSANSDAPAPATDIDGNARYDDPTIANTGVGSNGDYYDRGAYEFVGASCTDADGDGYYVEVVCGGAEIDCDDTNADINPGVAEICEDGIDNNCDGLIDGGGLITYYYDGDGDSYGDPNISIEDCNIPSAVYVTDNTDCNDADPAINPAATEICDGVDNDCNNLIDENLTQSCGSDVGECQSGTQTCSGGSWGICEGEIGPSPETCGDGLDNNCDGNVDEGCCTDADGDGYYAEAGCGTEVDCDDSNPDINPGACDIKRNGIDEDCDGSDRRSGPACPPPSGGDPEICDDGIDNDGDGDIDCADADCIGDPACSGGCVPVPEICDDGIDNDCDGKADCADKKDCRNFPGC